MHAAFDWIRRLDGVPQDAVHHGEGDVATHTRLAVEALAGLPEWRARPVDDRVRLVAAVLLHDVAKPFCTQFEEDGRHRRARAFAPWRSDRAPGAVGVRRPGRRREHVAALVRHHQVPFWALERPDLERITFRVSLVARNDDLALLATADILGRICTDAEEVLENIELFRLYCAEQGCLSEERTFPSDSCPVRLFPYAWAGCDI